jgi:ubiquitin-conjugating enzyme E2 G1
MSFSRHGSLYSSAPGSSSTPAASSAGAAHLLSRQLKQMQSAKDLPGISCGLVDDKNVFEWEVMLMINDDCKYYGGMYMTSPRIFPPP